MFIPMEVSKLKNNKGFTFVETLISLLIVAFVVVSILNGFAHQMYSDRQNVSRNLAVTLAEAKIEEYLKFPASSMPASQTDYAFQTQATGNRLVISSGDPNEDKQFRRVTTVTLDGNMRRIDVLVEYGFVKNSGVYPFRVTLSTMRGG